MEINPIEAVVWYVAFLFSVTLHEAAHAWTAMRGGDLTAYYGGQVSLDPLPHIRRQPIGMVILPIISLIVSGWPIGFASAPYDPAWERRYPKRAALMSMAGPASNFSLVLISSLLIRIGMVMGYFEMPAASELELNMITVAVVPGFWSNVAMMLSIFFSLNLLLCLLNLIPLPPLDGSGAITFFLSHEATLKYQNFTRQPMLSIMCLVVVWQVFPVIFWPLFAAAINLLYPGTGFHLR